MKPIIQLRGRVVWHGLVRFVVSFCPQRGLRSSDFFIVSAKKEGGVEWGLMLGRKGWRRKGGREERDKC